MSNSTKTIQPLTTTSGTTEPNLKTGFQAALEEIEQYEKAQFALISKTPTVFVLDYEGNKVMINHAGKKLRTKEGPKYEATQSPAMTTNPAFAELRRKVYEMKSMAFSVYA